MNAETLLTLAERVEQASGPDREIDLEIMRYAMNIGGPAETAAIYTASLDAAMTLVPMGDPWSVICARPDGSVAVYSAYCGRERRAEFAWAYAASSEAATPALAFCAAALRARAAQSPNPNAGEGVNHE